MNPSPLSSTFKSAHLRATIVKTLLFAGATLGGISLVADALSLTFPPLVEGQELSDNPAGAALAIIVVLLALIDVIVYLTTVVFFLTWLYRAYGNLRAFNPGRRLDSSPGFAVGSFFIPFANMVLPYRAVRETWLKSGPPDEALLAEPKPPAWFPFWWAFWLLSCFAGNISMRASFEDSVPQNTATIIAAVADGLSILAAVFAYLVIDAIEKRQEELSEKFGLGKFSGPPPPPTDLPLSNVLAPTP